MRKLIVGTVLAALMGMAQVAEAHVIERDGASADGWANPGGCHIFVHEGSGELHVNCKGSDYPARIRYRYLKDRGVKHTHAKFSGVVDKHGGTGTVKSIRWLCKPDPGPRTGRVIIPAGLYVHIVSVRWEHT